MRLGEQYHRIERAILRAQPLLDRPRHLRMLQRPLVRCRRSVIALDHLRAFTSLLLQFERRLEDVHAYSRAVTCAVSAAAPRRRSSARGTPDRSLHRRLDLLCAARGDDDVHERAVIVEVGADNDPGEKARRPFNRLDDKAALARHQGQALRPARRNIHRCQPVTCTSAPLPI